jgi:hypothetical protein
VSACPRAGWLQVPYHPQAFAGQQQSATDSKDSKDSSRYHCPFPGCKRSFQGEPPHCLFPASQQTRLPPASCNCPPPCRCSICEQTSCSTQLKTKPCNCVYDCCNCRAVAPQGALQSTPKHQGQRQGKRPRFHGPSSLLACVDPPSSSHRHMQPAHCVFCSWLIIPLLLLFVNAVWSSAEGGRPPREMCGSAQGASQRRHQRQQAQPQGGECSRRICPSAFCAHACLCSPVLAPFTAPKPAARALID